MTPFPLFGSRSGGPGSRSTGTSPGCSSPEGLERAVDAIAESSDSAFARTATMLDTPAADTARSAASGLSRRGFLAAASGVSALAAVATNMVAQPAMAAPDPGAVDLHWLDGAPKLTTGCSWGVPWKRGSVAPSDTFRLTAKGRGVPVQSWPLAYWPDGSVKWTGHAVPSSATFETFQLTPGKAEEPEAPVTVKESGKTVTVSNGTLEVTIGRSGEKILTGLKRGSTAVATDAELVLEVQDGPDDAEETPTRTDYVGTIDSAEVEQNGPVRAVVKLSGGFKRKGTNDAKTILPWTLRIYVGSGDTSLRLVHTFIWDADPQTTFMRGLGLRATVPMTDELHNRHVRFGGEDAGVWAEPVRVLTGIRRDAGDALQQAQIDGTATPPVAEWPEKVSADYEELPVWHDYTLFQDSPDHFAVWKRTSNAGSWLKHAGRGRRASGFGYVGGASGGLGAGLRDFWERFPRAIDVRGAGKDEATLTLWSWAPQGGASDMRHYDTEAHGLDLAYEDVQEGFSTPEGIAASTEMELWALDATPSREDVGLYSDALMAPPQIVAKPEWYKSAGVFGRWSLPDHSTATRKKYEDAIASDVEFYAQQVDERQWYGFWDFGDVMHTYDSDRHEWRYDVGGYAWDNGELGTDAMLWYTYLRSGDPTAFRLARAMTRHISEVDTYHSGKFAGLGARHNVSHWGDGAKEARVGESFTRRFSYYLCADERLGDLIEDSLKLDETITRIDPLRAAMDPQTVAPARVRIGPDWYAMVSNWLTAWERTGDTKWRDKITTGMLDISKLPAGLFTGVFGGAVGLDPESGHIFKLDTEDFKDSYNLAMSFLGEQILWETLDLVDAPEFEATLLEFCRYVQASKAEKVEHYGHDFNPQVFKTIYSRMTAWAGEQGDEPMIRERGWNNLLTDPQGAPWPKTRETAAGDLPVKVHEIDVESLATNDAAQRNLAYIALLDIAPDEAP